MDEVLLKILFIHHVWSDEAVVWCFYRVIILEDWCIVNTVFYLTCCLLACLESFWWNIFTIFRCACICVYVFDIFLSVIHALVYNFLFLKYLAFIYGKCCFPLPWRLHNFMQFLVEALPTSVEDYWFNVINDLMIKITYPHIDIPVCPTTQWGPTWRISPITSLPHQTRTHFSPYLLEGSLSDFFWKSK